MVTTAEHREADDAELTSRLNEAKQELVNLRFQLVTGQLDNSARVGQVKRDVARILTVLREREIRESEAIEAAAAVGAHQRAAQPATSPQLEGEPDGQPAAESAAGPEQEEEKA